MLQYVCMKSLRLSQPYAIILVGLPGSGKTFFGQKFAETFNAPHLNASAFAYHTRTLDDAYELGDKVLAELTRTKQTIIIETDTGSRVRRTELAKQLREMGYQPLFVWVQVDEPTAYNRSRKQISDEEYSHRLRSFSPPHQLERPLVISGKHTYASQARVVLNFLARHGGRTETPLETPKRPEPVPTSSAPTSRSISIN